MKEQAKRRSTNGVPERRHSAFSAQESVNGEGDGEPPGDDSNNNDGDDDDEG